MALHLRREIRGDAIAWLEIVPAEGGPAVLGTDLLRSLDQHLTELDPEIAAQRIRALVLTGGRADAFVAGSDMDEVRGLPGAEEAIEWALAGQRVLRRLEELAIPTVAAIEGPCVEGGLELALACSYRLASDAATTRLGLPQVRLGLIPFLGGTVRLPRLIGIQASLELILTGKSLDAGRAVQIGLVDEVLPARHFRSAVQRFAENRVRSGRIRTGARRRVPRRLLEDTAPGRRLVFTRAARRLVPAVTTVAPAAERALRTVAEGMSLPLDQAFRHEAEVAGELIASAPARALLHALRVLQEARRTRATERAVERVAVLGAGAVGSELAYLFTVAELPVLIKDRRRDALHRGGRHVLDLLEREERDGAISARDARRRGDLVSSAAGFGGFGTLDLVVAAVGDAPDATEEALREAAEHTRADCILASCPPASSPSRVQQGMEHPERVVGLGFSRPTDLFPLLEIVPGEATDEGTVEVCRELARRLGRAPVVVPDTPDTPASRLLSFWFGEALRLLEEGATVREIDRSAEDFGFTLGPFRRMDAIGVQWCVSEMRRTARRCGERMAPSAVVQRLTGSPPLFYQYRKGLPEKPNPGLPAGIPAPGGGYSEMIQTRMLLGLVNEAALLLEEHPSLQPQTVDVVALAGLGFPRRRGGLLYHCDQRGPARLVEELQEHAARFGDRFSPAPLLRELASARGTFYGSPTGHAPADVLT